jgi:hypothetical protein
MISYLTMHCQCAWCFRDRLPHQLVEKYPERRTWSWQQSHNVFVEALCSPRHIVGLCRYWQRFTIEVSKLTTVASSSIRMSAKPARQAASGQIYHITHQSIPFTMRPTEQSKPRSSEMTISRDLIFSLIWALQPH